MTDQHLVRETSFDGWHLVSQCRKRLKQWNEFLRPKINCRDKIWVVNLSRRNSSLMTEEFVNLIHKPSMILNYNSRVVVGRCRQFSSKFNPRVLIYDHRAFIRLTNHCVKIVKEKYFFNTSFFAFSNFHEWRTFSLKTLWEQSNKHI